MIFMTRQPRTISLILNSEDYKASKDNRLTNGTGAGNDPIIKKFGYQPIFLTPMINKVDFIIRYIISCASCPEVSIIFETKDYDVISSEKWFTYLGNPNNKECDIKAREEDEKEYFTSVIKKDSVLLKINTVIKTGNLQNDSYNMIYYKDYWEYINKYFNDDRDIIKLLDNLEFCRALMQFSTDMSDAMKENNIQYNNIIHKFRRNIDEISKKIY